MYGVIAMSKSTIQNWNAKSQIWNPKCQGVMQFLIYIVESIMQNTRRSGSLQCRIEIRDPKSQFAMQNRNQRSNVKIKKSNSEMQNVKAQCSFPIWNAKCQGAMQFSNSECKGPVQFSNSECKMSRRNAVFQF